MRLTSSKDTHKHHRYLPTTLFHTRARTHTQALFEEHPSIDTDKTHTWRLCPSADKRFPHKQARTHRYTHTHTYTQTPAYPPFVVQPSQVFGRLVVQEAARRPRRVRRRRRRQRLAQAQQELPPLQRPIRALLTS